MDDPILVKHAPGAPGLRLLGLGPRFWPQQGIEQLKYLLNKNTFWAKKRKSSSIKCMLSNSLIVVSIWKDNHLIGFGRATSDKIYRAVLWDIVVDQEHQNLGLGKKIIDTILNDKVISEVEKVYIMTTHCEDFYSKMGFIKERKQELMFLNDNQ